MPMFDAPYYTSLGLGSIHKKVLSGERLNFEDGLALFKCPDHAAIGALAAHARLARHGNAVHYVVNRQINYTNVCVNGCVFCAFRRDSESDSGAFLLSMEEILEKIGAAASAKHGLDEIHMVGGCHPSLRLEWFENLLRRIGEKFPGKPIKAFTPVEIAHFAKLEGTGTMEVLQRLKAAGLVMMPGGGAEIFDSELRSRLCPHKATADEWLNISGQAHGLGIKTNCTMLFGHLETYEQRLDHLCRLREQQDKSAGFTCFIPLPFLKENSKLKLSPDRQANTESLDRLRMIAVARLMLDNIPHIKAYWIMLGPKMAQTALWYGADDLDGTIVEEHIGHMAGAASASALTVDELESMIRQSGFVPVRRNALFHRMDNDSGIDEQTTTRKFTQATNQELGIAIDKARNGERLNRTDANALYYNADLHTLAALAHALRMRFHPQKIVTYVGDRNINYSNICVCGCRFCAFFRPPGDRDGYVITREQMTDKINGLLALGGTQVLLQGGHHPELPFEWYESLLRWLRHEWPDLHIHAFSPPEIYFWSQKFKMPVPEILKRLMAAGLDSIPGGGAEVLADETRRRVSPNKCTVGQWLGVMEEAHKLGMRTTATMMFGHEEKPEHRLDHLFAVRELQDKTGGFTAFIPWTFQPQNTRITGYALPAPAYLRLLALSRLVLDNIANIQASWVTMGPEIAQLALYHGANDFGSLMIEENVVAAAGVSFRMSREQIHAAIKEAGYIPAQRFMDYTLVSERELEAI